MRNNMVKRRVCRNVIIAVLVTFLVLIVWTFKSVLRSEEAFLGSSNELVKSQSCVYEDGVCKPIIEDEPPPFLQKGLYTYKRNFYLDGKLFRILSGSFHYFRTHPLQWGDRLIRMKAAGLNTVMTYIPWNLHEKTRGSVHLTGTWNIGDFIRQAHKVGLYVIVRAGPYICAEWEFGGLPSWLLQDPTMKVRSSENTNFMSAVERYFSQLLPALSQYCYKQGGPIIAFQIENEFGSYGLEDKPYLQFLMEQHKKYGIDELFFTSDGPQIDKLERGQCPGALSTVNFNEKAREHLTRLSQFQPNKPLMVTEYWTGWFDHWGESHHKANEKKIIAEMDIILNKFNASMNFYMFVGGSNHGFYNGANNLTKPGYTSTITSYDYSAPVAENGDITKLYMAVRNFIKSNTRLIGPLKDIPPLPSNPHKEAYGHVDFTKFMPYEDLVNLAGFTKYDHLVSMESLNVNNGSGQPYGFILYRTYFKNDTVVIFLDGFIRDRLQLFINGYQLGVHEGTSTTVKIQIMNDWLVKSGQNVLDLLVENMGRVNYRGSDNPSDILNDQRKGFLGTVHLNEKENKEVINEWHIAALDFDSQMRSKLTHSPLWKTVTDNELKNSQLPVILKGTFHITGSPKDTFLHPDLLEKGVAIVNGVNIGRYWNKGPQQTLYVPGPLLVEGENHVVVFELHKPGPRVEMIGQAILE